MPWGSTVLLRCSYRCSETTAVCALWLERCAYMYARVSLFSSPPDERLVGVVKSVEHFLCIEENRTIVLSSRILQDTRALDSPGCGIRHTQIICQTLNPSDEFWHLTVLQVLVESFCDSFFDEILNIFSHVYYGSTYVLSRAKVEFFLVTTKYLNR